MNGTELDFWLGSWRALGRRRRMADVPGDGPRPVFGRAAAGEERERLWERWRAIDEDLDAYAARRSMETAVVVLEPLPDTSVPG